MKRGYWGCGLLGLISLSSPSPLAALQQAGDSLQLGALHREAVRGDPRQRQLELYATQTNLRLRNFSAERLPALTAEGLAQYQSDVVTIPGRLPNGQPVASPEHETLDLRLGVQQSLFDPTLGPRREVERAQLAESEARVHTTLFTLRQEVNEAFFAAALLHERRAAVVSAIADLEERLKEAVARVREGAALPSDTAAIRAAMMQRRQDELELRANRRAALARLAALRGQPIAGDVLLALPRLEQAVAAARVSDTVRARPEYLQFARSRERLSRQESVVDATKQPRLAAFGRTGYGRPGLNLLGNEFDTYWVAGLQVQWAPWTWGRTRRERQVLELQREVVAADEAAFTETLERATQQELVAADRLDTTLVMDEEIIRLREVIEREARVRLQEGAITAAEYVDRSSDVLDARLLRAAHRVEQAHARARWLTMLGLEIP